jgi:hypothetical protein
MNDDNMGRREVGYRRKVTFWKILTVLVFVPMLVSFLISFSMYWWPGIPSSPQPAEGRIYPLNNHGHYTYMNRTECLLNQAMWWIYPSGMAALIAIEYFVDPFDHKRRWRPIRLPRSW